jgi:hypothetical protein
VGQGDDAARHDGQRQRFGGKVERRAGDRLVQPYLGDADRDQRIERGDDRQHRRDQDAGLEGALVQQEADRPDDHDHVQGPLAERITEPFGQGVRNYLQQERADAEVHTARYSQPHRAHVPRGPSGHREATGQHRRQSRHHRQGVREGHRPLPAVRPGHRQEAGDPGGAADDASEHHPIGTAVPQPSSASRWPGRARRSART